MENGSSGTQVITLTTDWNRHDYYIGMLTGRLLSIAPSLNVVELSHKVPPFDHAHAAFVLKHCFESFPKGTIHLCMVNADSTPSRQLLLFEHRGHHLIVPDNGVMGLVAGDAPSRVFAFPYGEGSFASLDAAASAVEALVSHAEQSEIAAKAGRYTPVTQLRAAIDSNTISGSVVFIDSYLNAITNISCDLFERVGKGRRFTIYIQSFNYQINEIVKTYSDVEEGELLALFNSINLLEVAMFNDFVAQMHSLKVGSSIMVKFFDD